MERVVLERGGSTIAIQDSWTRPDLSETFQTTLQLEPEGEEPTEPKRVAGAGYSSMA